MSKMKQDVPVEQRPFFEHMERIGQRHDYGTVFDDYLTMMINFWANGEQEQWRDDALKKYSAAEKQEMNLMFQAHVRLMDKMVVTDGYSWYDSLGEIYMTIISNWKASGMGQFFTPDSVVNMMAAITFPGLDDYSLIGEPACGSGRMILAAHARNTLCYYHATDLDSMCAKMTAINMCFHNMVGVVNQANTLSLEWYKGYIIERVQLNETTFIPYLRVVHEEKEIKEHWIYVTEYCRIMKGGKKETAVINQDDIAEAVEEFQATMDETLPVTLETAIASAPVMEETKVVIQQAVDIIKKRSKKYNPDQLELF